MAAILRGQSKESQRRKYNMFDKTYTQFPRPISLQKIFLRPTLTNNVEISEKNFHFTTIFREINLGIEKPSKMI